LNALFLFSQGFLKDARETHAQIEELAASKASATAKANTYELAYRAGYRRILFTIDQFCNSSDISDAAMLAKIEENYPGLYNDFPKARHDIHPFDCLESSANVVYGPPKPDPSYLRQLQAFCIENGKSYFPPLIWVPKYDPRTLLFDILAGLTVGVFLVPQGMAYALLAGLPVEIGLYASTVPVLIYAFLGTSRQMAVGPFALVALLVNSALLSIPPVPGATPEEAAAALIQSSVNLMLYVGLILLAFGICRLGFISNFISKSFLAGFTSASGILIQTTQIPKLLGQKVDPDFSTFNWILQCAEIVRKLPTVFWPTLLVGFVSLVVVLIFQQLNKRKPIKIKGLTIPLPAALIVIIFGILISFLADFEGIGIQIVGTIPAGFNAISIPSFDQFGAQFVNAISNFLLFCQYFFLFL
jgi:hypothetical protein